MMERARTPRVEGVAMSLRTRLTLYLNALLLLTVLLVAGVTIWTAVHSLRERARREALGTASLLASATSMTLQAPAEVERLVGQQMVVEARLAAYLVAVAEKAGLSDREINGILRDVTDSTVLDEFWITDPKGVAYLYATDQELTALFRFRDDPELQPQAHAFWPLLGDRTRRAAVTQAIRRRELDRRPFKYVGVSGVDKPRIVQVGYHAAAIERMGAELSVRKMVRNVIDAGNVEAIFVTDPKGILVACSSPGGTGSLAHEYRTRLVGTALRTVYTLKPAARFRGDAVEASVPLAQPDGTAGALICRVSTRELDRAVRSFAWDVGWLSFAGLLGGACMASLLARHVSGPIHRLAEAARVLGTGQFRHRVKVTTRDEVGMLGRAFNTMADSLDRYTAELARTTAEKEGLRREMEIASQIQRSLLPERCPELDGLAVAAHSAPAHQVGGDFYDFIPLPEGRWGIVIADASGKGVPAALLMALSRSLIRAYSRDNPSVLRALEMANRFMLEDMQPGTFVTCFYAVIDPARWRLTYVNAGHNPPVVSRPDAHVHLLPASGTPLGVIEESGLAEETCDLAPGDVVLMYTDGITEAVDGVGEQFGLARLQEVLGNAISLGAAAILDRVRTAVLAFAGDQPQFDDMTTIVLKVTPDAAEAGAGPRASNRAIAHPERTPGL
jgi:sigma-B regulation protein RsbU (phosphoserine phosphatase)